MKKLLCVVVSFGLALPAVGVAKAAGSNDTGIQFYGEAGSGKSFDFTKIANNGVALPASAVLGSGSSDWACSRDNVTGLTWEVKVNDANHFRHQYHTYTWYDSDSPDGYPGSIGSTSTCNNTLGGAKACNTENYVAAVNNIGLCGHSDWRMPKVKELEGIADFGRLNPTIDPTYFPNTPSSGFWSDSPNANHSSYAWNVHFNFGGAYVSYRNNGFHVRLVRSGQ